MSLRACIGAWTSVLVLAGLAIAGCAEGEGPPRRDGGARLDGATDGGDGGAAVRDGSRDDAFVEMSDGGRGMSAVCEECADDGDCADGYCVELASGGSACLPGCDIDLPDCPPRFECVANFTDDLPEPVCAPLGERCCVDADGDLYGSGVGCLGLDCDETSTEINASASETCDGVDENCDGTIDEGDASLLCVRGEHVAATACAAGTCVIETCEPAYDDCNALPADGCEASIETVTDCGACGVACALANVAVGGCDAGACTIVECAPGFGDCNGMDSDGCEQPLDTTTHCGGCGIVCGLSNAISTCATGTCAIGTCNRNWGDCDAQAVNGCEAPLTTNTDCGTCGTLCEPASGTGTCSTGTCQVTTCASGFEDCNASTVDGCETSIRTLTDCGACGVACGFPNATASCAVGACTLSACDGGWGNCDGVTTNGCETRVNTLTSCGACGIPCAPAHATGDCSGGTCGIAACDPGWSDCDGNPANGCETSLRTIADCGACDVACIRSGGSADCSTGMCRVGACFGGFGDCDAIDATGCETSLRTTADCGACGVGCSRVNATAACGGGTCGIASCNAGYSNCDGIDPNGCETSLSTLTSCGGCGVACARANASADCSGGSCQIAFCNTGFANCDGIDANGCETSLTTLTNCGACGTSCSLTNASESCASGACEITSCSTGYGDCNSTDSDGCETSIRTLTDCGACGATCARSGASATCASGTCSIGSCNPGSGNCDGSDSNGCEASLSSLTHCGTCGNVCDLANAAESCAAGTCALGACTAGHGNCDGSTVNGCETALTSLTNCGACGTTCALANAGESCATGTCEITTCSAGYDDCDGTMANGCERSLRTITDCGSCGTACTRAGATATCGSGSCAISSCNAGVGNCDGIDANGCEAPLTTLTHCGGCGTPCDLPNAAESCTTGSCTLGACAAGYGNCDGVASNGCEAPLNTLANCGGCGVVCDLPGGSESCSTGTCQVSTCASGFADCDGSTANGCEAALNALTNCGACGTACSLANGTESCSGGSCAVVTCDAGWENCDGLAANGCETPLNTLANCGACGATCDRANAAESCSSGTCTLGTCSAGFGNCDGNAANGCEAPLSTVTNCVSCGTACSLANAAESCSSGSCEVTSCNAGWGNCDGNAANGCETNTTSTATSCGACGAVCSLPNASSTCTSSACAIATCNVGWGNCDGSAANGCETPLNSVANCGMCGMSCDFPNSTEACMASSCVLASCAAGFGNCDGMVPNGCESSLSTVANCGGCGVVCNLANASETCPGGACTLGVCTTGYGNCDGAPANGCEQPLNTLAHCGGCAAMCSRPNATATCGGGACAIGLCNAGYASCDGIDSNGCETSLRTPTSCGGCGVACAPPNASGDCTAGTCNVGMCAAGWHNVDLVASNGCECQDDTSSPVCSTATSLGTLSVSGATVSRSGKIPLTSLSDYYVVSFPTPRTGTPQINFTVNDATAFRFEVVGSCGGAALGCQSGSPSATGLTSWSFVDNASTPGLNQWTSHSATWPVTLYIRVYRVTAGSYCGGYTIRAMR